MQKTRNPDCLYIKSLDILRPFLSLISYGCYSRMQIKNRLPYASAYDRRLELLKFSLSPTSWKCAVEKKKHRCKDDLAIHYYSQVKQYRGYVKDLVKALNAPFGYNIPRFKNLTIEQLFDRNADPETITA